MFALLCNTFDSFLYLDLDAHLLRDANYLFDYLNSSETDAIFWNDIMSIWTKNPILEQYPEGTFLYQRGS